MSYYILPTVAITLKIRNTKLLAKQDESAVLKQNENTVLSAKPYAVITNLLSSTCKATLLTQDLVVAELLYFRDFERATSNQLNRLMFQIFA